MDKPQKDSRNLFIIALIIIVIVLLAYSGYIPGIKTNNSSYPEAMNPDGATEMTWSDTDIFYALQVLSGKQLDYTTIAPYIDALHMKAWGIDGTTANVLMADYEAKYLAEGWGALGRSYRSSSNWVATMQGWTQVQNARFVVIGEGAAINAAYGHDAVILTAYGPATTFYQFYNAL